LYVLVLYVHSYTRWAVVVTSLILSVRTALGWARGRVWSRADEVAHKALMVAVNWQFTLGVIMYLFLSPFSHAFFANVGMAYHEPTLRFFGLEHPIAMLTAVSLVHFGRERSQRVTGRDRHRSACRWTLAAVLVFAIAIPWPFLKYGRPLLRTLSLT
jgi:hypothetical protein